MNKSIFKFASFIVCVVLLFSFTAFSVCADAVMPSEAKEGTDESHEKYPRFKTQEDIDEYLQNVYNFPSDELKNKGWFIEEPLSSEAFEKAQVFILADDREGLYDFLFDYYFPDGGSGLLHYFTGKYTGKYNLRDDAYDMVLMTFAMPHISNGAPTSESVPPIYGDVNSDNSVSISDVIMVQKICLGSVALKSYYQAQAADVDGSGVIDMSDVALIVEYLLDITDSLGN